MLRVLAYHRVIDPEDATVDYPAVVSARPADFLAHMRWVAMHYEVVGADAVVAAVQGGRPLPERAVFITFDDGYRDFGDIAWPIMRQFGLPATVFVPTSYAAGSGRAFWWDRLYRAFAQARRPAVVHTSAGTFSLAEQTRGQSLARLVALVKSTPHDQAMQLVDEICRLLGETAPPAARVLGWDELRRLAREGVTVAAHTHDHPALDQLPIERAREEIRRSRVCIEREVGSCPPVFAYPFGRHRDNIVELLRSEGFVAAVTTLDGHNGLPLRDPLRLRRTNISRRTTSWVLPLRLLRVGGALDQWRRRAPQPVT